MRVELVKLRVLPDRGNRAGPAVQVRVGEMIDVIGALPDESIITIATKLLMKVTDPKSITPTIVKILAK